MKMLAQRTETKNKEVVNKSVENSEIAADICANERDFSANKKSVALKDDPVYSKYFKMI